jgi:hypothetical protein
MLASSPSSHSPLEPSVLEAGPPPSHIANTSQQSRLSLPGSVPSPAVPVNSSALPALPSTAATDGAAGRWQQSPPANGMAVAPAAEQAAWGISATGDAAQAGGDAAARRASLTAEQQAAELDAEQRASLPDPAAGGSPAAASPLPSGTPAARLAAGQAGSPALATPYAVTEYDGEDVVMQDWGELPFSPPSLQGQTACVFRDLLQTAWLACVGAGSLCCRCSYSCAARSFK